MAGADAGGEKSCGVSVIIESKTSVELSEKLGLKPLAKILSYADAEQAPEWFTTTPSKAIPAAVAKAGLKMSDIEFFEINEAFSVVSIANNRLMNLDPKKVNINGCVSSSQRLAQ